MSTTLNVTRGSIVRVGPCAYVRPAGLVAYVECVKNGLAALYPYDDRAFEVRWDGEFYPVLRGGAFWASVLDLEVID